MTAGGSFWVDTVGLANTAGGFADSAQSIRRLQSRIAELIQPETLAAAAGDDKAGRAFSAAVLGAGQHLHDGVKAWADAVGQTGDGLTGLSRVFGAVEDNAAASAAALR